MLDIEIIPVLTDNYSYLLHDVASKQTAVVDPAQAEPVLQKLKQRGWQLDYIFNTHHHSDHVGGNLALQAATGCKIIAAQSDSQRIPGIKQTVVEGDSLHLGQTLFQVIATPGHTHGHIVYYSADAQCLLSGDTLFALGCGRLFEGTATQLWQSLQKLSVLPPQTRVYCAHEYTLANARFALTVEPDNPALQQRFLECQHLRSEQHPTLPSTIAKELATNPFLHPLSPAIQQHLHMQGQSATEIFTRLRKMKDVF